MSQVPATMQIAENRARRAESLRVAFDCLHRLQAVSQYCVSLSGQLASNNARRLLHSLCDLGYRQIWPHFKVICPGQMHQ